METVASEGVQSKLRAPWPGARSVWLSGIVLVAALARIAAGILDSPAHTFAETRLMPLVQTVRGLPAYPAPEAGPWYVPMYPPLSFLAFAPLLLASKPVAALRIAAALSELFVLLPAALLLVLGGNRARRVAFLGVASALVCWLHASPILSSVFFVHADAPAIFLAGLGVWLLLRALERGGAGTLAASIAILSLAPWAKQTFLPIALLPAATLITLSRRKALFCFLGAIAATGLWAALFGALFGARHLAFWTLEFAARHPWNGSPEDALIGANRLLVAESAALIALVVGSFHLSLGPGERWTAGLRRPPGIFLLASLLLWPGSVVGYVKVGGAVNSFIPTLFFLSCGAAASLLHAGAGSRALRAGRVSVVVLLGAQAALDAASTGRHALRAAWDADFAYATVRRDPSRVFFPWFPLSTYLASGALTHTELGTAERELAGLTLPRAAGDTSLPGAVRYVLCGKDPCPATLARFRAVSVREMQRGGTTWTAHEVERP